MVNDVFHFSVVWVVRVGLRLFGFCLFIGKVISSGALKASMMNLLVRDCAAVLLTQVQSCARPSLTSWWRRYSNHTQFKNKEVSNKSTLRVMTLQP